MLVPSQRVPAGVGDWDKAMNGVEGRRLGGEDLEKGRERKAGCSSSVVELGKKL